jgi:metal-responsive CopG/Arc/MetJ family transcriptional regulator
MKKITISMNDDLAQRARVAAARAGKSVSKYISEAAYEKVERDEQIEGGRNPQREAIEKILAGPMWDVTENGRMPTAEERNARR